MRFRVGDAIVLCVVLAALAILWPLTWLWPQRGGPFEER
jgi:hypothetical protein